MQTNMAGIEDYQMYAAHQLTQQQREEWERRMESLRSREPVRPSDLRLQTTNRQCNVFAVDPSGQDEAMMKRYIGMGVGWTSLIAEHLLSHPFVVLRRQCQVHNTSLKCHLVPLTLIPVIIQLHRRQGITTLWKGIGSVLLIRGVALAVEDLITKFTVWPKEISIHSSVRSVGQHIMLKCVSFAVITPFYSASLVETVQSEIASERPGIFDVFKEGACRLLSWGSPQNGRMLPVWALVVPTVAYGVFRYLFGLVVQGSTSRLLHISLRNEQQRKGALPRDIVNQPANQDIELTSCLVRDILSDVVFYPFETVLHRLHLQGTRTIIDNLDSGYEVTPILTNYEGARDCLETVQHEEGMSGLYKGFGALVLQYTAHFALIRLTKFVLTEVTQLLRTSRPKQIPGRVTVPSTPVLTPPIQLQRQYSNQAARTPPGLTPDQIRYFYPDQ